MIWLLIIPVLPYFFTLLLIWKDLRKIKPFLGKGIPPVKVSVIIACRNEEKNLPSLLSDLYKQEYDPGLFEVIIVDDNSTDNTFQIASGPNYITNLRVLKNESEGKKSAIKTGIRSATGELIITTDADCSQGKHWISNVASFYSLTESDMIIAPVELESKPGFLSGFMELEFLSLQGVTAGTAGAGNPVMCNGANLAFTREAWLRNSENLHNEILSGDDIFLLHSLKKESGSKIGWLSTPDAIVTTSQPESLFSFVNQRARWISKAKSYEDRFTLYLSFVTFVTILINIFLLITAVFNPEFLPVFLCSLILKSVPDYLILYVTTGRYNKRHLLKWFIPSQIVYPFYVIIVFVSSLVSGNRWK
jgi:biofilm PGA synthesis N-glycosyltransferase PgaC